MDPILSAIKVASPAPMPRRAAADASAPVLPSVNDTPEIRIGGGSTSIVDAEAKREQVVMKAAGDIANMRILGNTTFTMFRDTTGQIITRFRDADTGKTTYIPEPQLLQLSKAADGPNLMVEV